MEEQLLETWRIHSRINLYILNAIQPEAFNSAAPAKGRGFFQMFAHIHNNRLAWIQPGAPELMVDLKKIEKDAPFERALLQDSLAASGSAIETLLQKAFASGGKIKGFKPHAPAFIGYLISHEAYHHGEIGIALAQAGYPLPKETAYGMWEWGVR
jgi:uncharacterized damage-inducible protein DinB